MNSELHKFLREERKRVLEPDPYFGKRVMARLGAEGRRQKEIWDIVPSAVRPVFALALTLLLAFLTLEAFVPVAPTRSTIEAYLEPEQTTTENFLYMDADGLASRELMEQLIVLQEEEE